MSKLSEKYKKNVSAKEAKAIQKAMDEQKQNRNRFKEVPAGTYHVEVDKLELGESSWGDPQISIWFKITEGEYKNNRIFYNGTFDDHFEHGINSTAILLADLLDDEDLTSAEIAVILGKFDDDQTVVNDFLADASEIVEELSYDLDYTTTYSKKTNSKGQPYVNHTYEILDVYEG